MSDLMTLRDAVKRDYASLSTLRRRVRDGSLPSERRGHVIYVHRRDLDSLFRLSKEDIIRARAKKLAAAAPPLSAEVRAELVLAFGRPGLLGS